MSEFIEINPCDFCENPFKMLGKDWFLITAGDENHINTMTAGWGAMGVMWGKDTVFAVIRPQRYTKEFIDKNETFSFSFFNDNYKKELTYLGSVSGRTENKIQKSGLKTRRYLDTPYFAEADTVMICKKMYVQEYNEKCFLDKELIAKWYPQKDFHYMYIGEILKILKKD